MLPKARFGSAHLYSQLLKKAEAEVGKLKASLGDLPGPYLKVIRGWGCGRVCLGSNPRTLETLPSEQ